jgi:hypothetical protein
MRAWTLLVALAAGSGACRPNAPPPAGGGAAATGAPPRGTAPSGDSLRRELLRRVELDQAVRQRFTAALQAGRQPDSALAADMAAVDTANTAWLRSVITARGWPGRSLVGGDGAEAAFLLVQHADRDTAFQASTLPLLEKAYAAGDATGQQVALLTDRVAKARGRPQVYGTQASFVGGRVVIDPIADSAGVDARRARVGLPPLSEYVRLLDSVYTAHPSP